MSACRRGTDTEVSNSLSLSGSSLRGQWRGLQQHGQVEPTFDAQLALCGAPKLHAGQLGNVQGDPAGRPPVSGLAAQMQASQS